MQHKVGKTTISLNTKSKKWLKLKKEEDIASLK